MLQCGVEYTLQRAAIHLTRVDLEEEAGAVDKEEEATVAGFDEKTPMWS